MPSCLTGAHIRHSFSNAFLFKRSCPNQRTQIILERWPLDAWHTVTDLSDGERVCADGFEDKLPTSLTVDLFTWNGRERFALEHPQHCLFGLDELAGDAAQKLVRG